MVNGTAIPVTIEDDSDIGDDDDDDDDDDSALAYVRRHLPEAAGRWPKAATAELEARLWRRWRGRRGAHRARDWGAILPQQRNFGEWSDRGDSSDGDGSDDGRAAEVDGDSGRPLPIVICAAEDAPRSQSSANAAEGREGRAMWARRRWTRVPEGASIWSRVAVAIEVPISIEPTSDIELELLDTTEHFEPLPSLPRTASDPEMATARAAALASMRRRQRRRSVAEPPPSRVGAGFP